MPKLGYSIVIYLLSLINKRFARAPNPLGNAFRYVAKVSNLSGNNFRQARKCQTPWEMLSATWRKHQTIRETTFAKRGNAKLFGK